MNEWSERDLRNIREWNESKHPRDGDGKFTSGNKLASAVKKYSDNPERDLKDIPKKKMTPAEKIVEVNLNAEVQKRFDNATPKERSKIAFRYVMDNLRGKYPTKDNRTVLIERVGAKEMAHTLYEPKIRVIPELGRLIKVAEFLKTSKAEHGQFKEFAYYKVKIKIARYMYSAVLNVGVRDNGDSTLYDINQFEKI